MITLDEYKQIVAELLDELPEEFFRELGGGVVVSEAEVIPDYAVKDDIYVMGQYLVYSGVRQIVLFKGSFDKSYPQADAKEAKDLLRGILRHEFRHHLESRGHIHGPSSLEAEDARREEEYLSGHGVPAE